jgi:hypothetical protein
MKLSAGTREEKQRRRGVGERLITEEGRLIACSRWCGCGLGAAKELMQGTGLMLWFGGDEG